MFPKKFTEKNIKHGQGKQKGPILSLLQKCYASICSMYQDSPVWSLYFLDDHRILGLLIEGTTKNEY